MRTRSIGCWQMPHFEKGNNNNTHTLIHTHTRAHLLFMYTHYERRNKHSFLIIKKCVLFSYHTSYSFFRKKFDMISRYITGARRALWMQIKYRSEINILSNLIYTCFSFFQFNPFTRTIAIDGFTTSPNDKT